MRRLLAHPGVQTLLPLAVVLAAGFGADALGLGAVLGWTLTLLLATVGVIVMTVMRHLFRQQGDKTLGNLCQLAALAWGTGLLSFFGIGVWLAVFGLATLVRLITLMTRAMAR